MLKTRVVLRNVSRVLSNLIKRLIFAIQRLLLLSNIHAVKIHIFSLVHQLRLLHTLTFVFLSYLFRYCHMYFQLGRVYLRDVWGLPWPLWFSLLLLLFQNLSEYHCSCGNSPKVSGYLFIINKLVFFFFWGGGGGYIKVWCSLYLT